MSEEFDIQALANSLMVAIETENQPDLDIIFLEAHHEGMLANLVYVPVRGYEQTPLMFAIQCKVDIEIIHKLINAGADVNEENGNGITPLGELLSNITPVSSTGKPRDIEYTAEVFVLLLNSGVDVTAESDGKTPLELARIFLTDGDVKQRIIDMIEQRIELDPSLMDLTNAMDNVDEEPLETIIENMKEELSKPQPESPDGKKYLQLLDTPQAFIGYTPLFFMLKFTYPPENLLTYYNLFVEHYHSDSDSGEENILDQTYRSQTPIMMFLTRFNSKSVHYHNNPIDLLRKMCEDLKVGTGESRTGHPSRDDEINKRDMYGLTALDYANGGRVEDYIDLIKEIHPNAKTGTELGNIDDANSPFNGRPTKTGMLIRIFGEEEVEPSTPPHLEDFRVSPPSTPSTPSTPPYLEDFRVSPPSTPSTPGTPVTPGTLFTPDTPPSLGTPATPETFTPPGSPPPVRGRRGEEPPPRMGDIDISVSNVESSPVPSLPDPLPDSMEELIKLLDENVGLLKTQEGQFKIIRNLKTLFEHDKSLVSVPLQSLDGAPALFGVFLLKKVNPLIISRYIAMFKKYDVDPSFKSSKGTVLEIAIKESDLTIFDELIRTYKFVNLIKEEADVLPLYELANEHYESEKSGSSETDLSETILITVFSKLFRVVCDSSSDDNYKWLPNPLNTNVIHMNIGMDDPQPTGIIERVCRGVTHSDEPIKNNAKILEYLLKNGVKAYNANPYHEPMEDTPLALVLFDRAYPSLPSAEMVKLLLDYGAQVYMHYETVTEEGQYSEEFLWVIIDNVKEKRDSPPSDSSEDQVEWYQEEYNKIIALLYQAIALQTILLTPTTIMDGLRTLFEEERRKMLNNLIKFHPEAFQNYPKPAQQFEVKKINPNESVFDVIMQGDEEIGEFLEEDRENHIVLQDYDKPDSTFLIDLTNFRKAIDVEKDEDGNTVGGRVVMYQCNEVMESFNITMGRVKNLTPYFDLKGVAGWGGLIPLLEVYDKLLNKPVAERGQYFTYKVLDDVINPLSGIQIINYLDTYKNRYGNDIDVVSAAHCQEGQYSNLTTIIPAKRKIHEDEDQDGDDDDDDDVRTGGKRHTRNPHKGKTRKGRSRKGKARSKTVKKHRKTVNKNKMMRTDKRKKTLRNRRR